MSDSASLVVLAALGFCGLTILRLLASARQTTLRNFQLSAERAKQEAEAAALPPPIPEVR